jgi:all-trans-retinol 13,14-reductase
VLSATGVLSTVTRLLPEGAAEARWVRAIRGLSPASAHVCLYLGFQGDVAAAGGTAANQWFYDTWDMEKDAWAVDAAGPKGDADVLYCSFPSLKDPAHDPGPGGLHTGEVVTFVPWETFAPWADARWHKRGAAYEALKGQVEAHLRSQFFGRLPALEPLLRHAELSTPASTQHFVRPMEGSIYGLEPTCERFANPWLRPASPIQGLTFGGSDVSLVGVVGAMMGGLLGAAATDPLRVVPYVRTQL